MEIIQEHIKERFWSNVNRNGECWLWEGTKNRSGYGRFDLFNRYFQAHRIAWELTNGKIPDGLNILHQCDNPACVRPEHLLAGTQLQNIAEMRARGRARYASGEGHGFSKLNWEKVREVRAKYATGKFTFRGLAAEYGITNGAMWQVINRKTWRDKSSLSN